MRGNYTYVADLSRHLPDIPADAIVSRTLFSDDHAKAVLFSFAAGQELSEHTASMPAILHILEGEARLTLDGDTVEARAGSWTHIPPDLPHGVLAKTPVLMLLLLIKTGRNS
ncbi:MAG: cupin domain-containing protein [Nitrospinota bacterium]